MQNFYITLLGTLSELAILGVIIYSYFRETGRERQLLFWFAGFSLIAIGELFFLLSYLEILKIEIFERFFQILSAFAFLFGTIDFKQQKIWVLLPITFLVVIISLFGELIFAGKLRYIISFILISPILVFSGFRVILQSRILGLTLIIWGILTLFRFIQGLSIYFVFREVAITLLGLAILISILDRYRTKEVYVEKLYHTIVDAMNEALILLAPDEKITYINNRFCELMQCANPQNLIGRNFLDFVPERFNEVVRKKTEMIRMGGCDSYEIELKDLKGNIHNVIVSCAPYYDEFGNFAGAIGLILDITEKKRLEIDYQLASRLAAIGELAAGVAHNIKNPLQGIIFVAESLKRKNVEPQLVDMLIRQAEKINAIITNLQFKAVMDSRVDVQVFDLNVILKEELTFLQAHRFFKHEIEKDFQFIEEPLLVRGVYSDFSQIFSNIIKNAIDAMYQTEKKVLTVRTKKNGKFAIVEIGDTGVGIPGDILSRIWDMFFTTKPTFYEKRGDEPVGTGIGLAVVKRLLEKYNATAEVKTKVGEGTTFILKFPLVN